MKQLHKWIDDCEMMIDGWKKNWSNLKPGEQRLYSSDFVKEAEKFPQAMRAAVAENDIQSAVLMAADFVRAVYLAPQQKIINYAVTRYTSNKSRKAVNTRHAKRWSEDKKDALKRDFLNMRPKYKSDYAVCRELAGLILKDKNKWQQIQRKLRNMKVIN